MFCYIIQVTNFFDNSGKECHGVAVNSKTVVWSLSTKIEDTKDEQLRINKIIRNVNFHPAIYYPDTSSVSVWFVHISTPCAGSSADGCIQERIGCKKIVSIKSCSYKPSLICWISNRQSSCLRFCLGNGGEGGGALGANGESRGKILEKC